MTYSVSSVKIIKDIPKEPIHFCYNLKDSNGKVYKVTRTLHPKIRNSADFANNRMKALLAHAKFCEDVDHKTIIRGNKNYSKQTEKKLIPPITVGALQVQLINMQKQGVKRDKINEKLINKLKVVSDDNKKINVKLKENNAGLKKINAEEKKINAGLKKNNTELKKVNSELKKNNDDLKKTNAKLEETHAKLEETNAALKEMQEDFAVYQAAVEILLNRNGETEAEN